MKKYKVWCDRCNKFRDIRKMPERKKLNTHFLIRDNRGHLLSPLQEEKL